MNINQLIRLFETMNGVILDDTPAGDWRTYEHIWHEGLAELSPERIQEIVNDPEERALEIYDQTFCGDLEAIKTFSFQELLNATVSADKKMLLVGDHTLEFFTRNTILLP